jgi:hypothetical protein
VFTPAGDAVAHGKGLYCSPECGHLATRIYPAEFYELRICAREGCNEAFQPHACHVEAGMGRFCSLECWGAWRFYEARSVPKEWIQSGWSGLSRKRWGGRIGGKLGASAGIEAGRAKGGRPALLTPEQQLQILELDKAGHSSREIAEIVFGDSRLKDRVLRFLRR